MGAAKGLDNERPVHRVTLSQYCLDLTEVTVKAYRACAQAGVCSVPQAGGGCHVAGEGKDDHPQNCVTWEDAAGYCKWAGKRLPTEAEWEYAARDGGKTLTYPWGEAPRTSNRACWSREDTCPVGSFPAGPFGIHDLAGNVWEWVQDDYAAYHPGPVTNPVNTSGAADKVARGGGWGDDDERDGRAARRAALRAIGFANIPLGFRCAANAR